MDEKRIRHSVESEMEVIMKKKIVAAIVIASLAAFALAACGQKPAEEPQKSSSGSEPAPVIQGSGMEGSGMEAPGMLAGGWSVNADETNGWATDEAKAALEKATKELTGANYELISLLGTQVVSGTNYELLCRETAVVPNAVPSLAIVTVYEDLQGNAEITNVEALDLGAFHDATNPSDGKDAEQVVGGWSIPENVPAGNLPQEVATAYSQAMKDKTDFTPVAYLGSQVVAGLNYAVLAFNNEAPCLVYIYAPLEGDAELSSIYTINMADFSGN